LRKTAVNSIAFSYYSETFSGGIRLPFKNEENEDEVNPFSEGEVESVLKGPESQGGSFDRRLEEAADALLPEISRVIMVRR